MSATLGGPDSGCFWASGGDGGHVLFLASDWQAAAAELILRLWRWARADGVPLRITAHVGTVDRLTGADGGNQFVGEAINTAGRLLELGPPGSVLVSDDFRAAFTFGNTVDLVFHDPRWLHLRHRGGRLLCLASIAPDLRSAWPADVHGDEALLKAALEAREGWKVIYHAKRLLQVNTNDHVALRALRRLSAHQLQCETRLSVTGDAEPNPLLGPLDTPSRIELVRIAQLVERARNEFVCRAGDEGDMMFIVLGGEVGIVMPSDADDASPSGVAPALSLGVGDIVGELAFILQRPRTASVVATSDVALLGFQYREVGSRLRTAPLAREALRQVDRFMTERVVEHLYEHVPELVPAELDADVEGDPSGAVSLANTVACARLIKLEDRDSVSLEALAGRDDPSGGVYILASGTVRSASIEEKRLQGGRYQLLYVDLPGLVVTPAHHYIVERGAVIVHIALPAIIALEPGDQDQYIGGLRRQAADCYYYDVFLSYTFHDAPVVERWEQTMQANGLRVYRDQLRVGHQFPQRLESALADSLAVVAFISANTLAAPPEDNWVRREVEFREQLFESGLPVVIPVILYGGKPEALTSGHSPVHATGNEEQAIAEVVQAVLRIRNGHEDAPFARIRRSESHFGGSP